MLTLAPSFHFALHSLCFDPVLVKTHKSVYARPRYHNIRARRPQEPIARVVWMTLFASNSNSTNTIACKRTRNHNHNNRLAQQENATAQQGIRQHASNNSMEQDNRHSESSSPSKTISFPPKRPNTTLVRFQIENSSIDPEDHHSIGQPALHPLADSPDGEGDIQSDLGDHDDGSNASGRSLDPIYMIDEHFENSEQEDTTERMEEDTSETAAFPAVILLNL